MKEIPLTQGKIALVDDIDYEFLNQWKWLAHVFNGTIYARRNIGQKRRIYMHKYILGITSSY